MDKDPKKLTWKELLILIVEKVPGDQLDEPVQGWGDEIRVQFQKEPFFAEEDYHLTEEADCPRSVLEPEYQKEIASAEVLEGYSEEDFLEQHPLVLKKDWVILNIFGR